MGRVGFVLTHQGFGSTGEGVITIVEKRGAKRAGLTLDGHEKGWPTRPAMMEAMRWEYPTLYAALAAAGDVVREEGWPCSIRIKLFKPEVGEDRSPPAADALERGRAVLHSLQRGEEEDAGVVHQVIADLIERVEAAETRIKA